MSKEHPITPPPELVKQWDKECESRNNSEVNNTFDALQHFASKAARWGSDQELEECCKWVFQKFAVPTTQLRSYRRPKPLSLKLRIAEAIAKGNKHDALALLDEAMPDD